MTSLRHQQQQTLAAFEKAVFSRQLSVHFGVHVISLTLLCSDFSVICRLLWLDSSWSPAGGVDMEEITWPRSELTQPSTENIFHRIQQSFLLHVAVQSGLLRVKDPFTQFLLLHGRDNPYESLLVVEVSENPTQSLENQRI